MELEKQQRRGMVERPNEVMIGEIATPTTGQLAQMLKAIKRRAYNARINILANVRIYDIDVLSQDVVDDMAF